MIIAERIYWTFTLFVILFAIASFFVLPKKTQATGIMADLQCVGGPCLVGQTCAKLPGVIGKSCYDITSGYLTMGVCILPLKCFAINQPSIPMVPIPPPQNMPMGPTATSGCTQYYPVSTTTIKDPCAYYVPDNGVTGGFDTSAFSSTTNTNYNSNSNTNTNSVGSLIDLINAAPPATSTASSTAKSGSTSVIVILGPHIELAPGVSGDIQLGNGRATVIVNNRTTMGTVSGFYGLDTPSNQPPTGLIDTWCRTRPWANNFLSYIVPPTFFDSLCGLHGFKVGQTVIPTLKIATSTKKVTTQKQKIATTTPKSILPKPEVDIWAVPAFVKSGSRTNIFWNAKNVASCEETSPDGRFLQKTLTGVAPTAPLTTATTFTISCKTATSTPPIAAHVTVEVVK